MFSRGTGYLKTGQRETCFREDYIYDYVRNVGEVPQNKPIQSSSSN